MPRFVILEHDHSLLHWDLMLEAEAGLLTWRLARPLLSPEPVEATRLGDHRALYLDYEGPVSGGRGQVARWDWGTFDWHLREERCVTVALAGHRCLGILRIDWIDADDWRAWFRAGKEGAGLTRDGGDKAGASTGRANFSD